MHHIALPFGSTSALHDLVRAERPRGPAMALTRAVDRSARWHRAVADTDEMLAEARAQIGAQVACL